MDAGEGDYTQWTLGKGTIHNGRWGRGLYTMDAEEGDYTQWTLRKGTLLYTLNSQEGDYTQ